ncbi:MAG: two pore domain potassium channel family protein [Rhodobacteraceae bacterium]|nr:two pore domain potassium channel family protein [Paracoccaceae bacterium]
MGAGGRRPADPADRRSDRGRFATVTPDNVKLSALLGLALAILGGSTVFFHYVEHWSWLDSWFFTVVTVSTVGYGNLVPATALGKIATTALIFAGIGVFAVFISQIGDRIVARRMRRAEKTEDER